MRIRLEWEDDPVFATMSHPQFGEYRALTVKINGKPFSVWVVLDVVYRYRLNDSGYMKMIDDNLIATMERMFTKIFVDACAAIPDGTDLVKEKPSD